LGVVEGAKVYKPNTRRWGGLGGNTVEGSHGDGFEVGFQEKVPHHPTHAKKNAPSYEPLSKE
jgi:hypothetical protein